MNQPHAFTPDRPSWRPLPRCAGMTTTAGPAPRRGLVPGVDGSEPFRTSLAFEAIFQAADRRAHAAAARALFIR